MRRVRPALSPHLTTILKTLKAIRKRLASNVADGSSVCHFLRKPSDSSIPQGGVGFFPHPAQQASAWRPALQISGPALAAMHWGATRSPCPCCFWGILELAPAGRLRLAEAVLARQRVSPARCHPDMAWYGDLLAELHAQRALEPWQLACWILSRPLGLSAPSLLSRHTFRDSFGRHRLAVMLVATPDRRLYVELSSCVSPLAGAAPMRLAAPLQLQLEEPAARLTAAQCQRLERQYQERVCFLKSPGAAQPWPWDLPVELWPGDDPDFRGRSPYLPRPWLEAWREVQGELPAAELEDYLRGFLWRGAAGQAVLAPAAFDLDLIALHFDDELMSVWAASLLRERLRALARRRGWWP